jgi:arylsulfatase A-like enzyme
MKSRLLLVFLCFAFAAQTFSAPKSRPNIVFILADDLGYGDLGCYGATDLKTPNIDRLATQGIRFTDFYANGCVCTPTRCGLMTGRYQQRIGGLETAIPPGAKHLGLPPQEKTIADMLRAASYSTALSGKWHLGYKPEMMPTAHGFDHFFGLLSGNHNYWTHRENNGEADLYLEDKPVQMEGYSTHLITDHALKFLGEMKTKPFFLYVAFNAPHFPYQTPDDTEHEVAKTNWQKGSREIYAKMIEEMDRGVGRILQTLDENHLSENTLVIFASDNGGNGHARNDPLRGKKGQLFEGGIRAPCIARFPGVIPTNAETHQVAITMDWTATMAKLAGAKPPKNRPFEGIDLLPILSGKKQNVNRTLFWRSVNFSFEKLQRAVRDGNWKYIEELKGKKDSYLFDLSADIGEAKNLTDENPKLVAKLKKKLDRWEADVDPPLYPAEPSIPPK